MQIITTPDGRALEHGGEQVPLPALPVDATVHAYTTPAGLWIGIQEPGQPRPVYPGAGGQRLGGLALQADPAAADQAALEQVKRRAMGRINASYQDELDHILEEYPYAERLTWDRQEQEARAWWAWHDPDGNNRSGAEPAAPYLDALATGRGIDLLELVTRVIAKADAWIAASGAATGKRQGLEDQINAVVLEDYPSAQEAIAAVEAISW